VSQSPKVLHTSPEHARLRLLEDFVLHYAPALTYGHPPYLDIAPTPLTVYEDGVVLNPSGQERRATHRVAAPRRDDLTLQLCTPDAPGAFDVADLSVGGAKICAALGRVSLSPGERFSGWIRVRGQPYLRVDLEVVGARPDTLGGLALGLRFIGLDGRAEEWIARLVAACVALEETLLAA